MGGMLECKSVARIRIKRWADAHPDDPLADDIREYIKYADTEISTLQKTAISECEAHRKTLERIKPTYETWLWQLLNRMADKGLIKRACKNLTFKPTTSGWLVGIPKKTPTLIQSSTKGFGYIHQILKAANTFIDCTVLEGMHLEGNYIPDDIPLAEDDELQRLHLQIKKLETGYQKALAEDNLKKAAKYDNDKDAAIENLKSLEGFHGKSRVTGEHQKSRQRVSHAIKDAMSKLKASNKPFYDVLNAGLRTGKQCIFTTASDWDT